MDTPLANRSLHSSLRPQNRCSRFHAVHFSKFLSTALQRERLAPTFRRCLARTSRPNRSAPSKSPNLFSTPLKRLVHSSVVGWSLPNNCK